MVRKRLGMGMGWRCCWGEVEMGFDGLGKLVRSEL